MHLEQTVSLTRRRFVRGHLGLLLAAPLARAGGVAAEAADPRSQVTRRALAFGTRVSVTVAGLSHAEATRAADAALAEIAAVHTCANLHAPASPLARLNRDGHLLHADERLLQLLHAARRWGEATDGAFDVTVQPLWRLYFASAARGELPHSDALAQRLSQVDWRGLVLQGDAVSFARPGMQATLNGLAQGHAADRAWAVLRALGVEHALVDAGEWRAAGTPAPGRDWRIGVRAPVGIATARRLLDAVDLRDAALATSGDDGLAFSADRRAHHILDPRSGRSPAELAAVTVQAQDAASADALSTACMVMGSERSLALVAALPGAQALLLRKNGRVLTSDGWPGRLPPHSPCRRICDERCGTIVRNDAESQWWKPAGDPHARPARHP